MKRRSHELLSASKGMADTGARDPMPEERTLLEDKFSG